MQTLERPSIIKEELPPVSLRATLEFVVCLFLGLLLLEPLLMMAGISGVETTKKRSAVHVKEANSFNGSLPFDTISHIPQILRSKENPDVVMIGSSLVLWPAIACDGFGVPFTPGFKSFPRWSQYSHAKYFERLLQSRFSSDLSVLNITVAGSLMSDHNLILQKDLELGKRPKLVICCLHPAQLLRRETFPDYSRVSLALRNLTGNARRPTSLEILKDKFYLSLQTQQRKTALMIMSQSSMKMSQSSADKLNSNTLYLRKTYHPVDPFALSTNIKKLEEMIQATKRHKVPLLLVDMPVRPRHRALIDKNSLAEYKRRLRQTSKTFEVPYCDLNVKSKFKGVRDFFDLSHLNGHGGEKFYSKVVEAIERDENLRNRLCAGSKDN